MVKRVVLVLVIEAADVVGETRPEGVGCSIRTTRYDLLIPIERGSFIGGQIVGQGFVVDRARLFLDHILIPGQH